MGFAKHYRTHFTTTTSFHGISYAFNSSTICFRVFWVLVLIAAFSMAFYSTVQVVRDYLDAPVAITIMDVKSTFLELPDLVVCPVRGVNASKLKADNLTEYLIDGIMKYFATDVGWLYISGNENEKDLNFTTAAQELSDWMISHKLNDFRDLAIYYGYEPSEFIHSLSLGFDSILNGSHPSWTDSNFKKIIGYANGVCFAYANHHQINWPGIASGYNLVLKLPRQNQFDNSLTDGWNIGFTKPFTTAPTSHVRILPNTIVDIEITRTEIQRFPSYSWPKSGILCKDSKSYSSSDSCANQAYGEAVKSVCGCLYINTPTDPTVNLTNVRFCSTFERGLCGLLNENLISDETIKRQQECLPVCTETIFTAHPSYGAINKSKIIKKYGLNENSDISIVRISHAKMEYRILKSYESVTLATMISNIGGQLGLWIGASIVSIVHLLSFLPFWMMRLIKRVMGKRGKPLQRNSTSQTWVVPMY